MATKRMGPSKNNQASPADSLYDEDAGGGSNRRRYTEREIALRQLAIRLGMTRDDMHHYLGIG